MAQRANTGTKKRVAWIGAFGIIVAAIITGVFTFAAPFTKGKTDSTRSDASKEPTNKISIAGNGNVLNNTFRVTITEPRNDALPTPTPLTRTTFPASPPEAAHTLSMPNVFFVGIETSENDTYVSPLDGAEVAGILSIGALQPSGEAFKTTHPLRIGYALADKSEFHLNANIDSNTERALVWLAIESKQPESKRVSFLVRVGHEARGPQDVRVVLMNCDHKEICEPKEFKPTTNGRIVTLERQ